MTMTAKYPGKCSGCGKSIAVGDTIEWSKAAGARCAKCRGASQAPRSRRAVPRRPAPRRATTPLRETVAGEQVIERDGDGHYTVGETLYCGRVQRGGGPDGHYFVVVARSDRRLSQYDDDCREGEWISEAIVRAAADGEWQALAASRESAAAAKQATATAIKILTTGERLGRDGPRGARCIATDPGRPGSLASTPYIVVDEAGACYHVQPVYDDDPGYTRLSAERAAIDAAITTAGWTRRD